MRLDRLDLRLERRGINPEQHIAGLERSIRDDRDVDHLTCDIGHDGHGIADRQRCSLRRAPVHRNEQAEHQQHKHDQRRDLPEQVERNDLEPDQQEQQHQVDVEDCDDHRGCSG